MATFFRSTLETRNFSFEGFGAKRHNARGALLKALLVHGKQYKLRADWWEDDIANIEDHEMTMGAGYRDRNPLG